MLAVVVTACTASADVASAIVVPRVNGSGVRMFLQDAERIPVTPLEGTDTTVLRSELNNARSQLRREIQPQAQTSQQAERSELEKRVGDCANEAYDNAVNDLVTSVVNGKTPDFNQFMYSRAQDCVGKLFPEAPEESKQILTAIITAHGDQVALPAVQQASESTGETFPPPPPTLTDTSGDTPDDGSDALLWLALIAVAVGLGIIAAYFNNRKAG